MNNNLNIRKNDAFLMCTFKATHGVSWGRSVHDQDIYP